MLYTLLSVFLIVIPIFCWNGWGDSIRYPKENLSIIAMMSIIGVSFYFYKFRPFRNKWFIFFWIWCFLLTIFNSYLIPIYLQKIIIDMPSTMIAYKELFYITLVFITVFCIASVEPKERKTVNLRLFEINFKEILDFHAIAKVIAIIVIFLSVYAYIQALGLDELFRAADPSTGFVAKTPLTLNPILKINVGDISRRTVATLGNPSILAIFMAICVPLCLYLRSKLGYLAFLMTLIVILLTKSCMATIGLIAGVFVYLLFNHKKILLMLLVLSISIVLYFNQSQYIHKSRNFINPTGRIEVHKEAWKMIIEKPTLGYGLGSFEYIIGGNPEIIQKLDNNMWRELHDEFGQIWFTTGLVGLILFMGLILSITRSFIKNITEESSALFASLSSFLVISLGYFTMRVAPISFYGVIFLGLLLNKIGDKNA